MSTNTIDSSDDDIDPISPIRAGGSGHSGRVAGSVARVKSGYARSQFKPNQRDVAKSSRARPHPCLGFFTSSSDDSSSDDVPNSATSPRPCLGFFTSSDDSSSDESDLPHCPSQINSDSLFSQKCDTFEFMDSDCSEITPAQRRRRLSTDSFPDDMFPLQEQIDASLQQSQFGGAHRDYNVIRESQRHIERWNATERTVELRVNPPHQDPAHPDVGSYLEFLSGVVSEVCQDNMGHLADDDFVRVILDSDSLKQPISTSLVRKKDFNPDLILSQTQSTIQSNESVCLDDSFSLSFVDIQNPSAGRSGHSTRHLLEIHEARKSWRCITSVTVGGNLCMAAAICLGRRMCDFGRVSKEYTSLHRQRKQTNLCLLAHNLQRAVLGDARVNAMCTLEDVQTFQTHLPNYRIVVLGWAPKEILWKGPAGPDDNHHIFLLFDARNAHVDLITAPPAFLSRTHFCYFCLKGYNHADDHRCGNVCGGCFSAGCPEKGQPVNTLCGDCNRFFSGPQCLAAHKVPTPRALRSLCQNFRLCGTCRRRIRDNDPRRQARPHQCGEHFCANCRSYVDPGHLCYIKSLAPTPKELAEGPAKFAAHRVVYYDAEAYQDADGKHNANLWVAKDNQGGEAEVFRSTAEFCRWAVSLFNHGSTFVAHNAKGYDLHFIIAWYLENSNEQLKTIVTGSKILMLKLPGFNIQFIDSLSFLPTSLAKMPAMFGLQANVGKGFFPHKFNSPDNYDYDGPMPDIAFYEPDGMPVARRAEFQEWYDGRVRDNYRFNFWDEITTYCRQDVDVLLQCCEQFRRSYFDTSTVDPFRCVTIASACNLAYRKCFLPADTIGVIPQHGYQGDRQSVEAMEWLRWREHHSRKRIRHAGNGREHQVTIDGHSYKLDGLILDNVNDMSHNKRALEFAGCYIHGCLTCYHPEVKNKLRCKSMGELYDDFKARNNKLVAAGYSVTVMWSCQWKQLKKDRPEVAAFVDGLGLISPLNPRLSFFGGRTNSRYLHYVPAPGHKIHYYDFTSLYPYVNKSKRYPVGHPTILLEHEIDKDNMGQYFGLVKCEILPPDHMEHPVLPLRIRGKCMFVLCRTCARDSATPPCVHSVAERSLHGTWTSVDIMDALDDGYSMVRVHEVWHYAQSSDTLFSGYMNQFSAIKIHAGGFPADCDSPEKKASYIDDYKRVEGVTLDPAKMVKNKAYYSISKLFLNTLWGKFGERQNLTKTVLVNKQEEFWKLLFSNQCTISSIQFYGERYAQICYQDNEELMAPGFKTNVVIAAFTTAHARLHLRTVLKPLGKRVLYFDTDSVIFDCAPGDWCPPIGNFLGEFKSELKPDQWITEFVGAGPKNYGLRLNTGETSLKVRGFTLNAIAQQNLNFGAVQQIVTDNDNRWTRQINVGMGTKIVRRKADWTLHTVANEKVYGLKCDKCFICDDLSSMVWGSKNDLPVVP